MASVQSLLEAGQDSAKEVASGRLERLLRRLGVAAVLALGPAAIAYLAFNKGGYFPNSTAFAAIVFAQALVLRTVLSEHPFAGYSRRFAVPLIALTLFAALQLASALWSHSTALALDAYIQTLLYLLAFALMGSLPRSWLRMQWLLRGLAAALSFVCVAALVSRVLPHVWPTEQSGYSARLSYPLTYWNALGLTAAMATILLVHLSSSLHERRLVRVAAALFAPATATTLLLTYSRGAIAVAIVGLLVYILVGRPRALLSGALAIFPASAIGLIAAYDATLLSTSFPTSPPAVVQGQHVAAMVGVSMLVAAGVRAILSLRLDPWLAAPHPLPMPARGLPRWMLIGGPAVVVAVVLTAVGVPGYASRQFNRFMHVNSGPKATQVRERLTDPASNGRVDLWRAAEHQFEAHPLLGQGAGTFEFYWDEHRTETDNVVDAHNLYLQTLGEQGVVGLVLLLVVLLAILITLASRCRGPQRSMYAALFAVSLAWAIHAGVDWDWQMPAVTIPVFIVGGAVMASPRSRSSLRAISPPRNGTLIALGFLILAVAPVFVGISYQRLQTAGAAFKSENCAVARQRALSSISILAVHPDAYEILGYCDLKLGFADEGLTAMKKAESYESDNWNYHYGLAIALAANQLDPISEARRALQLNPNEAIVITAARAFERTPPRRWQQVAARIMQEGTHSGSLSISRL